MANEILPSFYDKEYYEGSGTKSNYKAYHKIESTLIILATVIATTFKPRSLLDIGCAYGHVLKYIKQGFQYGIDISHYAIVTRRSTNKVLLASASNIPFKSNTFDTIVCFETLEHLTEEQILQCFHEIQRVGTKWFFFTSPNPPKKDEKELDMSHINTFYPEYWIELGKTFNWTPQHHIIEKINHFGIVRQYNWNIFVFDIANDNI